MAKAAKPPREWRISIMRAKVQYVGLVEAADKESAIDKAMDEFKIGKAQRFRLIAEPVD